MTTTELHSAGHILLETIAGSQSYGLSLPHSDLDIRGVFYLPKAKFYGLNPIEQVSEDGNDTVFYELGRYVDLLGKNNPNILELLFPPQDCIRFRHPILDCIRPEMVLSKLCRITFAGYAQAQIKKAHGLNKKVLNPMDEHRKSTLEFCQVIEGQGTVPLIEWLERKGWRQEECGLVSLPKMRELYALFHAGAAAGELGLKGITQHDHSNHVSLSSIPKGSHPACYMSFNKDGYSVYCKEYREYWEWVEKRNEARYENTVSHGKNYDSKNIMHTFRLLHMAEEIAREGTVHVRRQDRDLLLQIRRGDFLYEDLVQLAEEKIAWMEQLYASSSLPELPDVKGLESALVGMREELYSGS